VLIAIHDATTSNVFFLIVITSVSGLYLSLPDSQEILTPVAGIPKYGEGVICLLQQPCQSKYRVRLSSRQEASTVICWYHHGSYILAKPWWARTSSHTRQVQAGYDILRARTWEIGQHRARQSTRFFDAIMYTEKKKSRGTDEVNKPVTLVYIWYRLRIFYIS